MLKAPKDNESDVGARFTWSETVNVDGVEKPVISSLDEATQKDDEEEVSKREPSERNMKVVWTLAHIGQASSFVWDPTLAVAEDETEDETADDSMISGTGVPSARSLAFL